MILAPAEMENMDALAARAVHSFDARRDLVDRLLPLINGTASHALRSGVTRGDFDRDDIRQQAVYYILHIASQYKPELGHALPFFVFRVRAKIVQFLQRADRIPKVVHLDMDALSEFVPAPPDKIDLGWELPTLHALEALRPAQRTLIELAYVYDLSDQSIADMSGRNLAAVRQQRYRALRRMKELL